ncbi:MAG TPA: hypothetical protein DIU00_13700, partial [Phycisphaerales bacterium]|nr:hypothetical protein [Phycisphaerales bacterium]
GTGMESHALHGDGIYYESGDKLWVNLYVPSTAQWAAAGVKLQMDTNFPEGESATLKLTLESPRQFVLALRRPGWAGDGFSVKVNGKPVSEDVINPLREVPESGRLIADRSLRKSGSYVELKRIWKTGDTVDLILPKTLRLEPLPDNPRRVAFMWGLLVLAGDLGPEERGRREGRSGYSREKTPVFIAAERPVEEWLKPTGDKPGHFRTDGVGRQRDVDLVPFYRLHRRTYAVYWDLFTEPEWKVKEAEYAAEQERLRKLEEATVAYAQPGEMQPERNFNFQNPGDSWVVRTMGRPGRWGRSWFSFDLPVESDRPMALVVTYCSDHHSRGRAIFDILVDGQKIANQEVTRSSPARFYDVEYAIEADLIKGKEKVTMRFQATDRNVVAAIFGIRMIRAHAER